MARIACLILVGGMLASCMAGRDENDRPVIYVLNPANMGVSEVPVFHFSRTLAKEPEGSWYKVPCAVVLDVVCTPLAGVWGLVTFPFNSQKIRKLEARRQRRVFRPHDEVVPERR